MEIMTMQDCSMGRNAYVQIQVHKETVSRGNAIMGAQETAPSKCVEALATSTSSTLMHTRQPLMTGAVETQHKIPTTKSGMRTLAIVARHQAPQRVRGEPHNVRHQSLQLALHQRLHYRPPHQVGSLS